MRYFLLLFLCLNSLFSRDVVFVKLDSALGNQMFQLAAAYSIAKTIDADLKVVVSNKESANLKDPNDRKYRLNNKDFHLDGIQFFSEEDLNKASVIFVWEGTSFKVAKEKGETQYAETGYSVLKGKGRIQVASFFESDIFFKEHAKSIQKMFTLRKTSTPFIKKHLPEIKKSNSVAVHIRRGDFKNFPDRILPLSYYIQAMQLFSKQKDVKFFIFSDDPAYAKDCFFNLENVVVVSSDSEPATNLEEFYLMTQCKHVITANSTFSWWAAYLCSNPDAIVVAPLPRYKDGYYASHPAGIQRDTMKAVYSMKAYPKHWKTIDPFELSKDR